MAAITSAQTGNWSATSTWTGGVVPVLGDSVTISSGHTVTVDGTYSVGDDTASAVQVLGTLKASRSANSQITVRGRLYITTGGTLDYGTKLDPIPSTVTAVIIGNDSATQAHNKYGIETDPTNNWAGFRMWGASKTPRTQVTVAALSTDTSFTLADVTGWQIGDMIIFDGTLAENILNSYRTVLITNIVGNVVTVGASLGFASLVGRQVINLTRNVRYQGSNGTTYRTQVAIRVPTAFSTTNAIELGNCEFRCTGGSANSWEFCGLNLYWQATSTTTAAVKEITNISNHNVWSISGSTATLVPSSGNALISFFSNQAYTYTVDNPVVFSGNGNQAAFICYSGTSTRVTNVNIIRVATFAACGFSQGPVGVMIDGGYMSLLSNFVTSTGQKVTVQNLTMDGLAQWGNLTAMPDLQVINCLINQVIGNFGLSNMFAGTQGQYINALYDSCTIASFFNFNTVSALLDVAKSNFLMKFKNINNDPTNQRMLRAGGIALRDNTTKYRSISSLAMYPWYTTTTMTVEEPITVAVNQTIRVLGFCQYSSNYGTSTPATLTISGMGATAVTFTCPTSAANTWFPIDLTITNPQSYPGKFTMTFSGKPQTAGLASPVYFDGILVTDFVTTARHYGFIFDSNAYRTVNSIIQQTSESTVGAYTGISINHGTQTITLTSNHTVRELYDYCQYNLCQTANLGYADFFSSTDGTNFSCSYNLTINGCALSGSANINMPSKTLSLVSGGTTTAIITHSAGTQVNITLTGLVSGSRVQLYDVTGASELYNAVVSGTSLIFPYVWTTNKTIRYRVMYCSGVTAYRWIEATATVTSSGLTLLISQSLDSIYNSIAVDGSTVTECSISGTSLVINITDPDNVTSAQRILAFVIYWLSTSGGIRDQNLYIDYADATHLVFEGGLKIKNSKASPLSITGASIVPLTGNPSDVIDTSGGSININTNQVVSYNDPIKYLTVSNFLGLK